MNTEDVVGFLEANWLALIFWSGLALVVFRLVRPVVDRIGERIIRARQAQGIDPAELNELRKRLATVENLVARLLRAAVIFVVVVVVLTLLDLVSVIVALGVVFAGLAIAGQAIILDYLMGILILIEGQFYVGDWVNIATNNVNVSGTVEEIGLRRTILRDVSGTVHSVSNGEVRVSSNMTRVYAVLQVEIPLMGEADLERAIAITNRVGAEMYADPEWSTRLLEAPAYASIPTVSDLGITLRAAGRVQGQDRFTAASELRRRLLIAYAAEGIGLAQRLRPPAA
ncbi:MAG TPA: mechanosensitive ion channel domain-containing protein [Candidatus Limnocylindria bacterium]|nr:mechanosensitive ion channel domain-containing protein [Candidatus Limnocylindria bacterium]